MVDLNLLIIDYVAIRNFGGSGSLSPLFTVLSSLILKDRP